MFKKEKKKKKKKKTTLKNGFTASKVVLHTIIVTKQKFIYLICGIS